MHTFTNNVYTNTHATHTHSHSPPPPPPPTPHPSTHTHTHTQTHYQCSVQWICPEELKSTPVLMLLQILLFHWCNLLPLLLLPDRQNSNWSHDQYHLELEVSLGWKFKQGMKSDTVIVCETEWQTQTDREKDRQADRHDGHRHRQHEVKESERQTDRQTDRHSSSFFFSVGD